MRKILLQNNGNNGYYRIIKWKNIVSQSRIGFEISHSNGATHLRTAYQLNQQTQMSQLSWLRAQRNPTRMIYLMEKWKNINEKY